MKIQVRQGMFETNSSSTHAICIYSNIDIDGVIGKYTDMDYKLPYKDHKLYFGNTGEFGWENKHYHNIQDKANYLWQCIVDCDLVDKLKNRITSVLKKYNIVAQFAPTEKKAWSDGGILHDCFIQDSSNESYGYVDHGCEAVDLLISICFSDRLLMNYLFNDESFIATGNDNDDNLKLFDEDAYDGNRLAIFFKGN